MVELPTEDIVFLGMGICFILIGLVAGYLSRVYPRRIKSIQESWTRVTAVPTKLDFEKVGPGNQHVKFDVEYTYQVNGEERTGTDLHPPILGTGKPQHTLQHVKKKLDEYTVGEETRAYVNPDDVETTYLEVDDPKSLRLLTYGLYLASGFCLIAGILMVLTI